MTSPAPTLVQRISRCLDQRRLLVPGSHVVVAVSGGPDSVCLLHLFVLIQASWNLRLTVAHVNHGLRGAEAEAEALLVQRLSEGFGLPCRTGHVDVRQMKRLARITTQEAARILRYGFLERVYRDVLASHIATAHTADDQAEEVLLRMIRGAGLPGLSGIPWTREGHIIRPLLGVSRREIMRHIELYDLPFVTDSSNFSPIYLRNRVRRELLPFLEERFNPAIRKSLARTASVLSEDQALLEELAQGVLKRLMRTQSSSNGLTLPIAQLRLEPAALRRRVYRQALKTLGATPRRLTADHLVGIDALIMDARTTGVSRLPDGAVVQRAGDLLIFRPSQDTEPRRTEEEIQVTGPGIWPAPGSCGQIHITPGRPPADPRSIASGPPSRVLWVDASGLEPPLVLRTRRAGDRFWPYGACAPRRLKGFLMARRVPRDQRDTLPLLVKGGEIVAVLGLEIAHPHRIRAQSLEVFALQWVPPK